jgi:hypothetical protein
MKFSIRVKELRTEFSEPMNLAEGGAGSLMRTKNLAPQRSLADITYWKQERLANDTKATQPFVASF